MQRLLFNIALAGRSIRGNKLRTVLTICIIGLGIMALVGILTSIEVINKALLNNFSSLGANSFQITSGILKTSKGKKGRGFSITIDESKPISYLEAIEFKQRFQVPATVSLSMSGSGMATVQYGAEKTNPNINVMGVDENYLQVSQTNIDAGRWFSPFEQQNGARVCVLGPGIAKKLFRNNYKNAVGKLVSVGSGQYLVAGITESKGGSMIMNVDNTVFLPLQTARAAYGGNSFVISVSVNDIHQKEFASDEAEGLFRTIRKLPLGAENNFSVMQNDELASILLDQLSVVRIAALFIGVITLIGSVIGLMNIMLVSVAERTREIGVSKALGAPAATIKNQFLTEAILISLLGGLLGIVLGILVGNVLSLSFDTGFVIPWLWIGAGFALCALVGVLSGIYPALKASRLDPIVALRYE